MNSFSIFGLCLLVWFAMIPRKCSAIQSCEDKALTECVTQYATGFADPKYQNLDDLDLHCLLDKKLAICANKYLNKFSSAPFKALARAALSYVVFEKRVKVCRLYRYKSLVRKLNKGKSEEDKVWKQRICRLLVHRRAPKCAAKVDRKCVRQYAQRMRKNPNLCEHIPFKSQCLVKGTKTCKADILIDILNVFPHEANKVLAVFCQKAQDSG